MAKKKVQKNGLWTKKFFFFSTSRSLRRPSKKKEKLFCSKPIFWIFFLAKKTFQSSNLNSQFRPFYLFHVLPLGLFSKLCKNPFSVVFTCFWKKKLTVSQFIQQQNAFRDSLIKQQMEFNKNLMSLMKSAGSSAAKEASRKRDDLDFFCCSEKYKVFELFREI